MGKVTSIPVNKEQKNQGDYEPIHKKQSVMTDYLNNPEENIAEFGSSVKSRLHKQRPSTEKNESLINQENLPQKKKNIEIKNDRPDKNITKENTVHIRISKEVELMLREALLSYYKSTGEKMSMREYADQALVKSLDILNTK